MRFIVIPATVALVLLAGCGDGPTESTPEPRAEGLFLMGGAPRPFQDFAGALSIDGEIVVSGGYTVQCEILPRRAELDASIPERRLELTIRSWREDSPFNCSNVIFMRFYRTRLVDVPRGTYTLRVRHLWGLSEPYDTAVFQGEVRH